MRTLAEVVNQFVYHPATKETAGKHDDLRTACIGLAERLWALIPDGPEKTLAFRKLQEAQMYGNLAIALSAPVAEAGTEAVARVLPPQEPVVPISIKDQVHTLDLPTDVAQYLKDGHCYGPVAVEGGLSKSAYCFHGLCTWTAQGDPKEIARWQSDHDMAQAPLRVKQGP